MSHKPSISQSSSSNPYQHVPSLSWSTYSSDTTTASNTMQPFEWHPSPIEEPKQSTEKQRWWDESQLAVELADDTVESNDTAWYKRVGRLKRQSDAGSRWQSWTPLVHRKKKRQQGMSSPSSCTASLKRLLKGLVPASSSTATMN